MPTARRLLTTFLGLFALLLVAVALWLPYSPVLRAGKEPSPPPYDVPPAVAGLRLHVFQTGMNRMSSLLVGEQRPWRPVPAFVLEHPRHGLLVFDAGLPSAVASEGESALGIPTRWVLESHSVEGRSLHEQMREAGLAPEDVRTVVVSHLHEDHLGSLAAFTNARVIGGPGTSASLSDLHAQEVECRADAAVAPFDAGMDLFGDGGGVTLLAGGGHSPEDLMALVSLPSGPVLLAGDAVVHRDWLESDDVQRIASDPDRAADVRNQVRAFLRARPEAVLAPGHDTSMFPLDREDIVLHHVEWFDAKAWPLPE